MFAALLHAPKLLAQDPLDGLWQGYDGEWRHVSNQLIALAEATPAEKFAWRPAPGVRSTSEVYMHIVMANFWLLSVTGPKMPADLKQNAEKTVTSKAEVIAWLKRSLEAVKEAHLAVKPEDLSRKVKVDGRDATVDGMYLRIIIHDNEHMGQLIAYARMTGVTRPGRSEPRGRERVPGIPSGNFSYLFGASKANIGMPIPMTYTAVRLQLIAFLPGWLTQKHRSAESSTAWVTISRYPRIWKRKGVVVKMNPSSDPGGAAKVPRMPMPTSIQAMRSQPPLRPKSCSRKR